jgi:eukaryotic-like serine/threonine-protein kinase
MASSFPSVPTPSAAEGPVDSRLGTIVSNRWRLDRVIGRGGMATVYGAVHRNRSRVAIKVVHQSMPEEAVARFLREGYLNNTVEHPGAVHTLDDGVLDDGSAYLVMELLEGEDLGTRLERDGRLPGAEAVRVAIDVLDVLEAAHRAKIVHRDVKPDNIFLLRSGGVKLVDFGIARERTIDTPGAATAFGTIMGTPAFMAPEQALGLTDEIDEGTDLWAVGATLFVALTGVEIRKRGRTFEETLGFAMAPVPAVRSLESGLSEPMAAVLDRALAHKRSDRFASAAEMREALRETERSSILPITLSRTGTQILPSRSLTPPAAQLRPSATPLPLPPEGGVLRASGSFSIPPATHLSDDSSSQPSAESNTRPWFAGVLVLTFAGFVGTAVWAAHADAPDQGRPLPASATISAASPRSSVDDTVSVPPEPALQAPVVTATSALRPTPAPPSPVVALPPSVKAPKALPNKGHAAVPSDTDPLGRGRN